MVTRKNKKSKDKCSFFGGMRRGDGNKPARGSSRGEGGTGDGSNPPGWTLSAPQGGWELNEPQGGPGGGVTPGWGSGRGKGKGQWVDATGPRGFILELDAISKDLFDAMSAVDAPRIKRNVDMICEWYMSKKVSASKIEITDSKKRAVKLAVGMLMVKHAQCEKTNMPQGMTPVKSSAKCSTKKCSPERGALSEDKATNRSNLFDFWTGPLGRNVLGICYRPLDPREVMLPFTTVETTTLTSAGGLDWEAAHWIQAAFTDSGAGETKSFFEYDSKNLILALLGAVEISKEAKTGPGHSFCGSIGTNDCHYNYNRRDGHTALPDASVLYQCALVESILDLIDKRKIPDKALDADVGTFLEDARETYICDAILTSYLQEVFEYKQVAPRRPFVSLARPYSSAENKSGPHVSFVCSGNVDVVADTISGIFFKKLNTEHITSIFAKTLRDAAKKNVRVRRLVRPSHLGPTSGIVALYSRLKANIKECDTVFKNKKITSDNVFSRDMLDFIKRTLQGPFQALIKRTSDEFVFTATKALEGSIDESRAEIERLTLELTASKKNVVFHSKRANAAESRASAEANRANSEVEKNVELAKALATLSEQYDMLLQVHTHTKVNQTKEAKQAMDQYITSTEKDILTYQRIQQHLSQGHSHSAHVVLLKVKVRSVEVKLERLNLTGRYYMAQLDAAPDEPTREQILKKIIEISDEADRVREKFTTYNELLKIHTT
jgi:hypothetical protein